MDAAPLRFETLVTDRSFRQWVENTDPGSVAYWDAYRLEHPEQEKLIEEARNFIALLAIQEPLLSAEAIELEIKKVGEKIQAPVEDRTVRPLWSKLLRIAAVLFGFGLFGTLGYSLYQHQSQLRTTVQVATPLGHRQEFRLEEGTLVTLNAGSHLEFRQKMAKNWREVWLSGEAYFKVTHDESRPFIVHTGTVDVQVLGTSFNVSCYREDENVEVELLTGAVMVRTQQKSQALVPLRPQEKITYSKRKQQWSIQSFESDQVISWRQGVLYFNRTPIEQIVRELERHFDVDITLENLQDTRYYSGEFKAESLAKILEGLSFTWDSTYKIEGRNVEINFKP